MFSATRCVPVQELFHKPRFSTPLGVSTGTERAGTALAWCTGQAQGLDRHRTKEAYVDIDRLARALVPTTRRAALGAGLVAAAALVPGATVRGRKKRNPCRGKNWCCDRTLTCGPTGGTGKCLVKATGRNVCAEVLFQVATCADCEAPSCIGCVCVLAAGGGDRCNNGVNGHDLICARPL